MTAIEIICKENPKEVKGEMVKFKVNSLADAPKSNSEIALNGVYEGKLDESKTRIYFTDKVGTEWIFYVNDTCGIV
jgi:hypothetical protein